MCNYCDSHYTKNGTWFNEDHKELLKEDFNFNLGTYTNTLTATVDIYGVDERERSRQRRKSGSAWERLVSSQVNLILRMKKGMYF